MIKSFKEILTEKSPNEEVQNFLFSGNTTMDPVLTRKPTNWIDLGPAQPIKKMPREVQDWIKTLRTITWKDLYGGVAPVKGDEFWVPHNGVFGIKVPFQYFLVKSGAKLFLINTEGYDHPRYAARLKK